MHCVREQYGIASESGRVIVDDEEYADSEDDVRDEAKAVDQRMSFKDKSQEQHLRRQQMLTSIFIVRAFRLGMEWTKLTLHGGIVVTVPQRFDEKVKQRRDDIGENEQEKSGNGEDCEEREGGCLLVRNSIGLVEVELKR